MHSNKSALGMLLSPCPLFRAGLCSALEPILHIVEATEAVDALEIARTLHPEIALLDVSITGRKTLELTAQLSKLGCRVVIFGPGDEEVLFEYQRHGAYAYESPAITVTDLREIIQRVMAGDYLISLQSLMVRRPPRPASQEHVQIPTKGVLTTAEMNVLKCILLGRNNKEAGRELKLSAQTVKNHVTSICRKLGTHNRTHMVVTAFERGLLSLEEVSIDHLVLSPEAFAARGWKFQRRAS